MGIDVTVSPIETSITPEAMYKRLQDIEQQQVINTQTVLEILGKVDMLLRYAGFK